MKRLIRMIKARWGFTLLEILAALSILAIGLVSILSLFPVGFQSTKRASEVSVASLYGQKKLETLLARGYNYVKTAPTDANAVPEDPYYEWEYSTLPSPPPSTDPKIAFIVMGVYWPSSAGSPHNRAQQQNMKFTTYVTDYTRV